ncbi:MAG: SMP-30/gluconolactonase/LRE family protein [Flavobacteriales bacterium]|nr:SMP-30/gluconolactonase/LRE family protein [Flavobacteriales bacterium]MBL6869794.1 SMP-30/gluconolactonase/LRE family protein [Flavobacteriales bacterium]
MKKLLFALFFLVNVSCFSQTIYNVILEQIAVGDVNGPEAIAFDGNGLMYTANEDGRIIVLNRDGSNPQDYAQTGGRPLGLKFDSQGNLIVADAFQGLLSIDTTGQITVLSTSFAGVPFMLTDDLDIGSDGTIYFSDASSLNSLGNHTNDWGQPNGRLLSYNPNTDVTNLLLDNLYFANGVALSHDESYLLVNESAVNHVRRYWLTGPNSGQTDVFSNVNQFQGLPDNITYNDDSLFWVATFFGPVIALDNNGQIVYQLNFNSNLLTENTSAIQYNDTLYLGTLHDSLIGKIPIPTEILLSNTEKISQKSEFTIYPNPTNENITISVNNHNGNINTEVYDIIGNRIQTTNKTTISLRDYSKGIYILKVAYGDRVEEVKVIKE